MNLQIKWSVADKKNENSKLKTQNHDVKLKIKFEIATPSCGWLAMPVKRSDG
jgi:hypothetical protein